MLQMLWPTPFKIKKGNLVSFLVQLIIFLVVVALVGWLFKILSGIPVVGIIFAAVGSLIGLYSLIGVVLCFLCFFGVLNGKKKKKK